MAAIFHPIAPRPAPRRNGGARGGVRGNLFADWNSGLATLVIAVLVTYLLPRVIGWAVVDAVFARDADACQAARGTGACWGVVAEKWRFILLGRYPFDAHWRPVAATILLCGLLMA